MVARVGGSELGDGQLGRGTPTDLAALGESLEPLLEEMAASVLESGAQGRKEVASGLNAVWVLPCRSLLGTSLWGVAWSCIAVCTVPLHPC